jgi:hypothetical protein
MRRLAPLLILLLLVGTAGAARADDVSDAAMALRTSPVFQAAGLDLVDAAVLRSELSGRDPRVLVAVLPASAAASDSDARARAIDIGRLVNDSGSVVLVITADEHFGVGEGHTAVLRGVDARAALRDERAGSTGFTRDTLTAFVASFAERIANQAASDRTARDAPAPTSTGNGRTVLLFLLVAGAVVVGLVALSSRRRAQRLNEGLRAEVVQLYERLGSEVATLEPAGNKVALQALADASERFTACGAALAQADAPAEFAAARRTAVEGLTAARAAREALGLDPGPAVPVVPGDGPQLAGPEQIALGGQTFDGSPQYEPGRQHYFGGGTVGGRQVPGGWYSAPFWEPFLLGAILTGGLGGLGGHGGFERGYDEGFEAGRDDTGDQAGGGGDWGGGDSGGDWGGGGDGGGGGDW